MLLERGSLLNNRYRIIEILGQGGMGSVYRAVDENLSVDVAVKDNLFTTEEYARQFRREAVLLATLRHPNLPRVTDHFVIDGQGQYLVMDYIEGEDLRQRMDRVGLISEEEVIIVGAAICDALTYLSSCNPPIVHRDIKPGNVRISPQGHVYLVDFGLAKDLKTQQTTTTGARAMTPGYSPPEQYGGGITDARSDIYSLGATLYTLVTGSVPVESVKRHMGAVFLQPREIIPEISTQTESVILKAMELNPDERYQTADQFCLALSGPEAFAQKIQAVGEAPPTVRTPSMPGREPASVMVAKERQFQQSAPGQVIRIPLRRKRQQKITVSGALVLMSVCILAILGVGGGWYSLVYLPGLVTPTSMRDVLALTSTELARIIGNAPTTGAPSPTPVNAGFQTSTIYPSSTPTGTPSAPSP